MSQRQRRYRVPGEIAGVVSSSNRRPPLGPKYRPGPSTASQDVTQAYDAEAFDTVMSGFDYDSDDHQYGGFPGTQSEPGIGQEGIHEDDIQELVDDGIGQNGDNFDLDMLRDHLDGFDENIARLPIDVDFGDIQQADQYGDAAARIHSDQHLEAIPTEDFNESGIEDTIPTHAAPLHQQDRSARVDFEDEVSQEVPHVRVETPISKGKLALGLWCQEVGISRESYKSLLEILRLPELRSQQFVDNLPSSVSTLKRQVNAQLPLLKMRTQKIPLLPQKLTREKTDENLYFFDFVDLVLKLMNSNITDRMHFGFGEFHDDENELWKSHAWRSSIRTTSGEFLHYSTGEPVFPSDVVTYRCQSTTCPKGCQSTSRFPHIGRITDVGRDFRYNQDGSNIVVKIMELLRRTDIIGQPIEDLLSPPLETNEVILSYNNRHYVLESSLGQRQDLVYFDYEFQDRTRPRDEQQGGRRPDNRVLLVRRMYDFTLVPEQAVTPLCLNHPLRGELEIAAFGRHELEKFDPQLNGGRRTISVPFMTFIDGFGLYRNMYRSLMGMYLIPAALNFKDRNRRVNVLPLTLGPHGSNFADVIDALASRLQALDRGIEVDFYGQDALICAFSLAYKGDMPQQQANSGMKSMRGNLGCRFCYVSKDERGDLEFDIIDQARTHYQTMGLRDIMSSLNPTAQAAFGTEWGLDPNPRSMALSEISPALDIILSRPGDPVHSEYNGMSKLMHRVLISSLQPVSVKEYAQVLRSFPFPPGWPRVESPIHHLKSYSSSEHARWSIVIPLLLRCWLRPHHLRPALLSVLRVKSPLNPISYFVECFAKSARSNCMLMGESLTLEDRAELTTVIHGHRQQLQELLILVARSLDRTRPPSIAGSQDIPLSSFFTTPEPELEAVELGDDTQQEAMGTGTPGGHGAAKASAQYLRDTKLPNIHVALHYPLLTQEYGLPANFTVLIGEDKHRFFKKIIYQTNHKDPEKDLLYRENIRQTLRLLRLNAFRQDEPELTFIIQQIYNDCPSLFSTLLTRSEQGLYDQASDDVNDDQDLSVIHDHEHIRPQAINRIAARYCQHTLGLPTRSSQPQFTTDFAHELSNAWAEGYGTREIINFRGSLFQWCKKLSFTNPQLQRRYTFKMGDVVEVKKRYHGRPPVLVPPNRQSSQLIRINHIFVHTFRQSRRLFIRGTELDQTAGFDDPTLGTGYVRLSLSQDTTGNVGRDNNTGSGEKIFALSTIEPRQLYIIPVSSAPISDRLELHDDVSTSQEFLWAQRSLQWL